MLEVIFKPIPGYEGLYSVSNRGDVLSHRGNKLLSPKKSESGYLRVTLCNGINNHKTYGVHRLVALAFIPNPCNKPTVNHINEIKADNRADNLEWATNAEQNLHGTRLQRAIAHTDWKNRNIDYTLVAKKHNYSLQSMCNRRSTIVFKNGKYFGSFCSQREASKRTGVSESKVSQCVNGLRPSYNGFSFREKRSHETNRPTTNRTI